MPWRAQGLDNLRWWNAWARAPVVAIGGILDAERVLSAASCGVDGVCVVRAVADDPARAVPHLQTAMRAGRAGPVAAAPTWPRPTLTRPEVTAGRAPAYVDYKP